jgi:predicted sugar kinase
MNSLTKSSLKLKSDKHKQVGYGAHCEYTLAVGRGFSDIATL